MRDGHDGGARLACVSYRFDCTDPDSRAGGIARALAAVSAAELVVVPTDAVYGVGCDAFSGNAVSMMFATRGSGRRQPPPVLIAHARTLDGIATGISDETRRLAEAFWPGGLTLVCRAQPTLDWDLGDAHGTVSVRVPLHPVALELLEQTGPMALTSACLVGEPAPVTCDEARDRLGESVSVYLDAGRMTRPARSTIVDARSDRPRVLRLGAVGADQLRAVVPDLEIPGADASSGGAAKDEEARA